MLIGVQAIHVEGVGAGIFATDGLTENAVSVVRASGVPTAALFRTVIGGGAVFAGHLKGGQKTAQQGCGMAFVDTPYSAGASLGVNVAAPGAEGIQLGHLSPATVPKIKTNSIQRVAVTVGVGVVHIGKHALRRATNQPRCGVIDNDRAVTVADGPIQHAHQPASGPRRGINTDLDRAGGVAIVDAAGAACLTGRVEDARALGADQTTGDGECFNIRCGVAFINLALA